MAQGGSSKVINLKMNLLTGTFSKIMAKGKQDLNEMANAIQKVEHRSKGLFSTWQKGIVVWNQAIELARKLVGIFQAFRVPLLEAGSFEQFRTVMENLTGSTEVALERFQSLVDFAAKTPFNVPGVVAAGNRLEALGRYSLDLIRDLGDLAAASGKPVMQAVEAYTNMVTGRTGIAVKQFRAMLISTRDWTREIGKSVLQTGEGAKASVEEMVNALPDIIASKNFTGLMEKQSKTMLGMVSNMEDAWQQAMASIGDEFLEQTKVLITGLMNFSEWIRDEAPKIISVLKDIWSVVSKIGVAWLLWKAGIKIIAAVKFATHSLILPTKVLNVAVRKQIATTKLLSKWRVLANKHTGHAKILNQQLGRVYKQNNKTMSVMNARIAKTILLMRTFAKTTVVGAIIALGLAYRGLHKMMVVNHKVLQKTAAAEKRNTIVKYDLAKAQEAYNKTNRDALAQYIVIQRDLGGLNDQNEEHLAIIQRLRVEYPQYITSNEDYNLTIAEAAVLLAEADKETAKYGNQLDTLKEKILDAALEVERLNVAILGEELKPKLAESFQAEYTKTMTEKFHKLGMMGAWALRILDDIFLVSERKAGKVTDALVRQVSGVLTFDELAAKDIELRETIDKSERPPDAKDLLYKQLDQMIEKQRKYIENKYKKTWGTEDSLLKEQILKDIKGLEGKDILDRIDEVMTSIAKNTDEKGVKIGESFFSTLVPTGKKVQEGAHKGEDIFDVSAGKERIAFINKILQDERNKQADMLDTAEKEKKRKQKAYDKERSDALKAHQERLALLTVLFEMQAVKDYEGHTTDILILQENFQNQFLAKYKDSNSKELQFKKKLADEEKGVDKKRVEELQKAVDKIITVNKALENSGANATKTLQDSYEALKGVLVDVFASGVDLESEAMRGFFNKLKDKLMDMADDLNKAQTLTFYLDFHKKQRDGTPLSDALPEMLGLTPEGLADIRDAVDEFIGARIAKEDADIVADDNLSKNEKLTALYESQTKHITDQVKALQAVSGELALQLHFEEMTDEQRVFASQFITDLENQIASLKSKLVQLGVDLEADISDNVADVWKKAIQGISAFTSHLGKAANSWYSVVAKSTKKQVDAWRDAQNIMIDDNERKAMFFARTTQQEERIREEADQKRQKMEEEADKEMQKRMKVWFDFKKAADIASILSSTATAMMAAWTPASGSNANPVLAGIITGLISATSVAQIAAVSAQEMPGFKRGGFTGNGKKEDVAGVVHGQEFVVKKGPAQKFRDLLEAMNNGYQSGGMAGVNVNRDLRLASALGGFNAKATQELVKLNKNLEFYLANPVPARAYLDDREAGKITRTGISKIRRSVI